MVPYSNPSPKEPINRRIIIKFAFLFKDSSCSFQFSMKWTKVYVLWPSSRQLYIVISVFGGLKVNATEKQFVFPYYKSWFRPNISITLTISTVDYQKLLTLPTFMFYSEILRFSSLHRYFLLFFCLNFLRRKCGGRFFYYIAHFNVTDND